MSVVPNIAAVFHEVLVLVVVPGILITEVLVTSEAEEANVFSTEVNVVAAPAKAKLGRQQSISRKLDIGRYF
jgi:hypothetical protein